MKCLKKNGGQFIPISAMVMFTMVLFMIAVVNVYKVSKTKLKVQNLADAAALNLASQEAQAFNMNSSRNEWLNHMVAGAPSPSDTGDCTPYNMNVPNLIPGIGCVENVGNNPKGDMRARHIFASRWGAINYGMVVHTVNAAQKLFVEAYNSFLGATKGGTSTSATAGPGNFLALLKQDIPELGNADTRLIAWNTGSGPSPNKAQSMFQGMNGNADTSGMKPLSTTIDHDISTRYMTNKGPEKTTFGKLLYGRTNYGDGSLRAGPLASDPDKMGVGWMVLNAPQLQVKSGSTKQRAGVGVYVSRDLDLPFVGRKSIMAKATAFVVEGSGTNPKVGGASSAPPIFKPTYWVKLAN